MPIFKNYFKILKSLLPSILIYGVIFLAITLLMVVSVIQKEQDVFNEKEIPIYLINQDENNIFIEEFLTYLDTYVEYIEIDDTPTALKDALFHQEVKVIITIPEGFTESLFKGNELSILKQSSPDSTQVTSVDTAINQYVNTARMHLQLHPEVTHEEMVTYMQANQLSKTEVIFDIKQQDTIVNSNLFNMSYFNYLGYIILACFIGAVSTIMVSFHGNDIMRRHNASPVSSRSFNLQLVLANLSFVMCYMLLFIIAGFVCNQDRVINYNTLLIWINALLFAFTALCISYLIGITVKSNTAVSALSTMVSLSLAFLSGIFVPQEFLGDAVLKLASFTPTYWYVKANNTLGYMADINGNQDTLQKVFGYYGIQIGFAMAFLSIALVVSKLKRQSEA